MSRTSPEGHSQPPWCIKVRMKFKPDSEMGSTRPKIGYLVGQYPAVNHTYVLSEIRELRRLGIDVEVASISPPDRPVDALSPEEAEEARRTVCIKALGIGGAVRAHAATVVRRPVRYLQALMFPLRAGRGDWRRTLSWIAYFVEAVMAGRWMEKNRLDHIHVHFSGAVGLLTTKVFPVSMSLSVHGFGELYLDPIGNRLADQVAASTFVRTVSKHGRSQLMRLCPYRDWDKFEHCPLGVDTSDFRPRPFRASPSPFTVVSVGRLAPEKGQRVLVTAIARLAHQGRNVRLHLVGDGPDRARLEREAAAYGVSERVVFEGWMDQHRLRSIYSQADAAALSSFVEGIPVVLMEAMAMEIPCIATNITGIPELIRNGTDGILVAPSDDEDLARAIASLMDDPGLRRMLGIAARQRVVESYDLRQNARRFAALLAGRLGHKLAAEQLIEARTVEENQPAGPAEAR